MGGFAAVSGSTVGSLVASRVASSLSPRPIKQRRLDSWSKSGMKTTSTPTKRQSRKEEGSKASRPDWVETSVRVRQLQVHASKISSDDADTRYEQGAQPLVARGKGSPGSSRAATGKEGAIPAATESKPRLSQTIRRTLAKRPAMGAFEDAFQSFQSQTVVQRRTASPLLKSPRSSSKSAAAPAPKSRVVLPCIGAEVEFRGFKGCKVTRVFDDGSIEIEVDELGLYKAAPGSWTLKAQRDRREV